jgi:hypothetical protein
MPSKYKNKRVGHLCSVHGVALWTYGETYLLSLSREHLRSEITIYIIKKTSYLAIFTYGCSYNINILGQINT